MNIHHAEEYGRDSREAFPPQRPMADPVVRRAVRNILEDMSLSDMCDEVARSLGVRAEAVAELVARANAGEFLFHGVKREKAFHDVRTQGILPVTPEGSASYWTSGVQLFGDPTGTNPIDRFFNSTFFNYAHVSYGRDRSSGPAMMIALTRAQDVRKEEASFTFQPDAELAVHEALPPEDFSLFRVECSGDENGGGRWVQQKMFDALCQGVRGEFSLGTLVTYEPNSPLGRQEFLHGQTSV